MSEKIRMLRALSRGWDRAGLGIVAKSALFGIGVLVLSAAMIDSADASCERSARIFHSHVECLDGGWNNRGFLKKDTAWAQNMCPEWGKVVAKVDRLAARDWTWNLTTGTRRTGKGTAGNIRGVYCCTDLSDLCRKSDLLTVSGCEAQFDNSSASATCSNATVTVSGENCMIAATCKSPFKGYPINSSITVHYLDTDDVENCDGRLEYGTSCGS